MRDEQIQKALAGEVPIEDLSEADQEHVRAVQQFARERHDELLAEYRATRYTYRVEWDQEVRRWCARCDQLHGFTHLGTTPEAAIRGVITAVGEIVKNNQEWWWTEESQAGEREVDEAVERGEVEVFDSGEEFLHHLDQVAAEADREAVADAGEGTDSPWRFLRADLVPRFLTGLRAELDRANHEGVYVLIERWRARAVSRRQQLPTRKEILENAEDLAVRFETGGFEVMPASAMISVAYLRANPDVLVKWLRDIAPERLAQDVIPRSDSGAYLRPDREPYRDPTGTGTDIHRTVPTDAAVDYQRSGSFYGEPPTMYVVALPVHLNPGYDVQIQPDLGYFLDPHEAAVEARKRLEFQVGNGPVEHRHNFAVSGAAVIPVSPNGYEPGLPLRPWSVRLARKGTDSDQ